MSDVEDIVNAHADEMAKRRKGENIVHLSRSKLQEENNSQPKKPTSDNNNKRKIKSGSSKNVLIGILAATTVLGVAGKAYRTYDDTKVIEIAANIAKSTLQENLAKLQKFMDTKEYIALSAMYINEEKFNEAPDENCNKMRERQLGAIKTLIADENGIDIQNLNNITILPSGSVLYSGSNIKVSDKINTEIATLIDCQEQESSYDSYVISYNSYVASRLEEAQLNQEKQVSKQSKEVTDNTKETVGREID